MGKAAAMLILDKELQKLANNMMTPKNKRRKGKRKEGERVKTRASTAKKDQPIQKK